MSAFAMTPDMQGLVYYRGWYIDNPTFQDKSTTTPSVTSPGQSPATGAATITGANRAGALSTASVDQRIRLWTRFKVADGLDFVLRMDWMEDKWGPAKNNIANGNINDIGTEPVVAFDWGYTRFTTVAGTFQVGWQPAPVPNWGTDFNNSGGAKPGILWTKDLGALRVGAAWQKEKENAMWSSPWSTPQTDKDKDLYAVRFNYDRKKGLDFGAQLIYSRDASNKPGATGFLTSAYAFQPYVITKIGPVAVQGELFYAWGDAAKFEVPTPGVPDISLEGRGAYVDAKLNMGPAYVGASYIYMAGDDPATADKMEGNHVKDVFGGGSSLRGDRLLFSGSDYYTKMVGAYRVPGVAGSGGLVQGPGGGDNNLINIRSFGLYGGFSPSKKLSTEASVWMLKVDKAPNSTGAALASDFVSDDIGKEFAATANYKIFDNLAVQVDFAYLWTGDYFKGISAANTVGNNYFINSWLILDF
jgi:hypothetical protein